MLKTTLLAALLGLSAKSLGAYIAPSARKLLSHKTIERIADATDGVIEPDDLI